MSAFVQEGTERSEPWLSLEDDEQRVRCLLIRLAREIHDSCLVGHPAPKVAERFERMTHPQPGDLVIEASRALYAASPEHYRGVGYLVAERDERIWEDEDPSLTQRVHYVQYGPSSIDVCRWENADFIAVDLGDLR